MAKRKVLLQILHELIILVVDFFKSAMNVRIPSEKKTTTFFKFSFSN